MSEIEKCYSDQEINIPHESLICDLKLDWAAFITVQQPFLGPTPIKYRKIKGSKLSTEDCMFAYMKQRLANLKMSNNDDPDVFMK